MSMYASKNRLRWAQVPADVKAEVERLAGAPVVRAASCEGGFSPGLASGLTLAGGRMVFVKAMDADAWPGQATTHRAEASVSAALPASLPAPRLLGSFDDGHWVVLVFEYVDGAEPDLRRRPAEASLVAAALGELARKLTPSPIAAPAGHPRLGGWADVAADGDRLARLPALSPCRRQAPAPADRARSRGPGGGTGGLSRALRRVPAQHLAGPWPGLVRGLAKRQARGAVPRPGDVRIRRGRGRDRPRADRRAGDGDRRRAAARHRRGARRARRLLRVRQPRTGPARAPAHRRRQDRPRRRRAGLAVAPLARPLTARPASASSR